MAALIYTSDAMPGLRRRRAGRGFVYLDARGRQVRDPATIARIRQLAIPPAYTDVWICADPRGHLQATGRDARGRKQYRYHRHWQAERGAHKYDRIIAFAEALPRLRRQVRADLALPGFPRERVVALVVALLGQTLLRVGNAGYQRQNGSYGITTLRNAHARFVASGQVRFAFRGKGGRMLESTVNDARLVALVRRCQQLPGQALFQYRQGGAVQRIGSGDINAYLQAQLGGPYSAKDFRTWGATLYAFRRLAALDPPAEGDPALSAQVRQQVLRETAAILGNTPRICEKCYVDPRVFDGWQDGRVRRAARNAKGLRQWELAAIRFLKRAHRTG
ncbi:DNA topoisomerase IB [Pseudoxanthomonas wuyuanensis]|uniref:DNA topoisomerase n=1 Tax=Pseudoxanthomonas wuyuanensis TaxID=1073196 RepID=A0A286D5Z9_9GAMM|nr:DNA topoisomerase IB [Pseudoxanthomonas wuyuanensis]SOD54024.1 DNA topoisomerase IB [Pseudoxanthomonas wuyuanensis]